MPDTLFAESYGRPLPTSYMEREQDLEFVLEFVTKSNEYREPFLASWPELIDNYTVTPFGQGRYMAIPRFGHPSIATNPTAAVRKRSVLKDPETHQNTEGLAAQSLGLMFGSHHYLSARPVGFDDYEKARVMSRVIQSVFEGRGVFRTVYQSFKEAFVVSASILEMGWLSQSRQQITEIPILDENGEIVEWRYVPQEVVYREGPGFWQCDGFDFYPDPSGTRIHHDMIGVAKRFRITQAQAERAAEANRYDKEGVKRASDKHGSRPRSLQSAEGSRFDEYSRSLPDKLNVMTGIEYWGFCPYKHADGASNRVITILEGEIVRSTINPHVSGMKPFFEIIANPVTGQFYGLPSAMVNRFLQDSADNALMKLNDAFEHMVNPGFLLGTAAGINPEQLQWRAINEVIKCGNPDAIKPIPNDLSGIAVMQSEHARRKMQMREASGFLSPVSDFSGGGDRTATEASERVRLASQRTEIQVMLWERDTFPQIAHFAHSMLRQFSDPDEGGIAYLNGEPMPFSIRDIDYDADIRFNGSRQAMSRFQLTAGMNQAITTITNGMKLIPHMPDLFIRLLRDGMEIVDAEQIIARAVQSVQAQMQAEQAMMISQQAPSPPRQTEPDLGTETGLAESEGRRVA